MLFSCLGVVANTFFCCHEVAAHLIKEETRGKTARWKHQIFLAFWHILLLWEPTMRNWGSATERQLVPGFKAQKLGWNKTKMWIQSFILFVKRDRGSSRSPLAQDIFVICRLLSQVWCSFPQVDSYLNYKMGFFKSLLFFLLSFLPGILFFDSHHIRQTNNQL